jgi:hypothetical protein
MNPSQFDTVTRLFAARRTSRRTALAVVGGSLASVRLTPATAQETSPVPVHESSPVASDATDVPFMFVQTFGAGSLAPKPEKDGVLVLTADHLAGQTLYFSDRPERIVGMVATERFLGNGISGGGMGFTSADPPNAALVFGNDAVVVAELADPMYDPEAGTITYELRVLADVDQLDLQLEQAPLSAADAPRDFAEGALFIDDCPNGTVTCTDQSGDYVGQYPSSGVMGFCWDSNDICCLPCESPPDGQGNWDTFCNQLFPNDCQGSCTHGYNAAFSCDF